MAAGSLAAKAGAVVPYPLATSALSACLPETFEKLAAAAVPLRPSHEDPEWISELADSLGFKEVLRYKFKQPGHINVLEARMYKTFQKYASTRYPDSPTLSLLDSRVTLGAVAKGRSSSPALCRILQGTLPYTLGGGLYAGNLHVYSAKNRADGPSRGRPADAPTKALPVWYTELCQGRPYLFDLVVATSRVPKLAARWLRFLLLLGGDIEPRPGPNRPALVPRGPLDLTSGFTAGTVDRMSRCLAAFRVWLLAATGLEANSLGSDAESMSLALRAYGLHLFSTGHPRYLFVYAITAVQDTFPALRGRLMPAWQIDAKWQYAEPGECRPVISAPIIEALTAVGLLWEWPRFVGVVLIGFLCMLHPSEYLALTRADVIFPSDALSDARVAYVHVRNPKTQRFARRQHCKLEDVSVLDFLEVLFEPLPFEARLYPGSENTFRSQWNAVMLRLGIPHSQAEKGATPGVLRGSRATHLYLSTEDLGKVAWRGRWVRQKTVEYYLQEVAAQIILQRLCAESRERISALRPFAAKLMRFWVASGEAV